MTENKSKETYSVFLQKTRYRLLKEMSDDELRRYNSNKRNPPLEAEISNGISFRQAYDFAFKLYQHTREYMLGTIQDDSLEKIEERLKNRKMTEEEYSRFEEVVRVMKDPDNYLERMKKLIKDCC